jgi:NAD(P)H dehydrogenase (quinone)
MPRSFLSRGTPAEKSSSASRKRRNVSSNKERTLLVVGASGYVGRRVVEILLDAEENVVAATRTPEKLDTFAHRGAVVRRADLDDPSSLEQAFVGVERVLLISTNAPARRGSQHRAAIDAAILAGAQHIVYTSFSSPASWEAPFGRDHAETETALRKSGLSWTILRNNLYTDSLVPKLSSAIGSGRLEAAAGSGAAGYVTRDDCAAAAAVALASAEFDGQTFDVTGPGVVTFADLAKLAGDIGQTRVVYVPRSPEEIRKELIASGVAPERADVLVSIDEGIANGWFQTASDGVEELAGRPPASVSEFLAEHSDVLFSAADPALSAIGRAR